MNVNVTDPAFYGGDPYPAYAWLREHAPVHRDVASDAWVVSRHEDVVAVSKDPAIWSAEPSILPGADVPVSIACMDDPRHQRLRNLVNKGFTPRRVGRLEPKARALVAECLEALEGAEAFDLVRSIAVPLPLFIIADMIGIPRADFDRFHRWSDDLIGVTGGTNDPAHAARSMQAYVEYGTYLKGIFEERRRRPQDDLVSILVAAQDEGQLADDEDAMENDELVMFMTLLLVAGNETTRNAISGGMEAFLRNPEQRELLRRRPELVTCVFPDPERFDITRSPNPHVAFGIGKHFCLGANLARMEIRVAIEELMRRLPDLELAPGREPVRFASTLVRGLASMPVVVPRRAA